MKMYLPLRQLNTGLFAAFVLLLQLFSCYTFASSDPLEDTTSFASERIIEEATSGEIWFRDPEAPDGAIQSLALQTHYQTSIAGLVAETTLTQTFINPSQSWQEAEYVFPLPETAAVYALEIILPNERIKGVIKEKEEAEKTYHKARKEGRRAAVLHQQRPNMFRQKIANIGPGESIEVQLSYQQAIDYHGGTFSFLLPLTITPRYIPGQVPQATIENLKHTLAPRKQTVAESPLTLHGPTWLPHQLPDNPASAQRTSALQAADSPKPTHHKSHRAQVDIRIYSDQSLGTISSPSHQIETTHQGQSYTIRLPEETAMDRDFVLHWQTPASEQPEVSVTLEQTDQADYLQVLMLPPHSQDEALALPRETLWIIDTSGSMEGVSLNQAVSAMRQALATLRSGDYFNVIEFNSHASALFPVAKPADAKTIQTADRFLSRLSATGGTEIGKALDLAFTMPTQPGLVRQIVFLTDGSVGNERQLLEKIHNELGSGRLFTVAIGPAPNRFFMRKAAEIGRGSSVSISDHREIHDRMNALLDDLKYPQLSDISLLDITGEPLDELEVYPSRLPDLYAGDPLKLLIKLPQDSTHSTLQVSGNSVGLVQHDSSLWQRQINLDNTANGTGIARAWARAKVDSLSDRKIMGASEEEIRSQILELALRWNLVSPYTSFVAVSEEIARPGQENLTHTPLGNRLPKGINRRMATFPGTDAGADYMITSGLWYLLIAIGLMVLTHQPWFPVQTLFRRGA